MLINGVDTQYLLATDRGLLYGDGVFETIAVCAGMPQFWQEHIQRLHQGCEKLSIKAPSAELLRAESFHQINNQQRCVLKIIVTRGIGHRGYRPELDHIPTRIVQTFDWPAYPHAYHERGVHVTLCSKRLSKNKDLAGIKHLNRLEQVMARGEWQEEYQEGLMCDIDENVVEGTMSNFFLEKDQELVTPDLTNCGVAGIIRGKVIQQCKKLNIEVDIRNIKMEEVLKADAMFLCNSIIGLWQVVECDKRKFSKSKVATLIRNNLFG